MYKSPISMIESISDHITEKIENELLVKVTTTVGFDVDKEELLKALKYDRGQYDKGYDDAKSEIIYCEECRYGGKCLWEANGGYCHMARWKYDG